MIRKKILTRMMREATLTEKQKSRIKSASSAFSIGQLRRMKNVGIRFWQETGYPSAFDNKKFTVEDRKMTTRAEYLPNVRLIRLKNISLIDDIRHEIAHAWDHLKGKGISEDLERINVKNRERALTRRIKMWSESKKKHKIKKIRLTISEMLDRYKSRARTRENSFGNPQTREGYSFKNVREFYAEGYSVYFGSHMERKVNLFIYAEELFQVLYREGKRHGLSATTEKKIKSYMSTHKRESKY